MMLDGLHHSEVRNGDFDELVTDNRVTQLLVKVHRSRPRIQFEILEPARSKILLQLMHDSSTQAFALMGRCDRHLSDPGGGRGDWRRNDTSNQVVVRFEQAKVELALLASQILSA